MNQLEKLLQRRSEINNNIIKGFLSDEEIDFIEKASRRAVGEAHPNGKWVWTDLGNGKYNWRVPKGKGAAAGSSDDSNKKKEEKKVEETFTDSKGTNIKVLNDKIVANTKYGTFKGVIQENKNGRFNIKSSNNSPYATAVLEHAFYEFKQSNKNNSSNIEDDVFEDITSGSVINWKGQKHTVISVNKKNMTAVLDTGEIVDYDIETK